MVGSKDLINPLLPILNTQRLVSRDIDTIALDGNRSRMIRRAIEVYHQPRKSRNQQDAIQPVCYLFRKVLASNVQADMRRQDPGR